MSLKRNQLVISGFVTLALALSASMTLPVGAISSDHVAKPMVASQCYHPGYKHFGFPSLKACLQYVAANSHQGGHGYDGNGGGNQGNDNTSTITNTIGDIFSHIGFITHSTITVTINFITNIFN